MFLCEECIRKNEKIDNSKLELFEFNLYISYGPCEDCGKTKETIDI